ncbi:hypothetical protein ACFSTE_01940 [Aquimarina hainanensis]|uniref:TonB protein C-terminal n=1 Tax=Aquimarina hainanensis TaxID=1578017 RepID=A0ABW5N368_9FLAO
MGKNNWYIILLLFFLSSCDFFLPKKESREDIVKKEWEKLNQHEVEQPPLFTNCKNEPKETLEICFSNTITTHIEQFLSDYTVVLKEATQDTVWVSIIIDKEGGITYKDFEPPAFLEKQIPNFKTLLTESLLSLPEVKPGHVRGTTVTTQYRLPILIKVD